MKMIAALLILALCGCEVSTSPRVTRVDSYQPELYKPPRPTLEKVSTEELAPLAPEARKKLISNNDALQLYAKQMEFCIESYNEYARTRNGLSAEALGKKEAENKETPK